MEKKPGWGAGKWGVAILYSMVWEELFEGGMVEQRPKGARELPHSYPRQEHACHI